MDDAEPWIDEPPPPTAGRVPAVVELPLAAYRAALARYGADPLPAIQSALGGAQPGMGTAAVQAGLIVEHLENPRSIEAVLARLDHGSRLALGLFALTEASSWPVVGLSQALECLGVEPLSTVRGLVDLGVLAVAAEPAGDREPAISTDPASRL